MKIFLKSIFSVYGYYFDIDDQTISIEQKKSQLTFNYNFVFKENKSNLYLVLNSKNENLIKNIKILPYKDVDNFNNIVSNKSIVLTSTEENTISVKNNSFFLSDEVKFRVLKDLRSDEVNKNKKYYDVLNNIKIDIPLDALRFYSQFAYLISRNLLNLKSYSSKEILVISKIDINNLPYKNNVYIKNTLNHLAIDDKEYYLDISNELPVKENIFWVEKYLDLGDFYIENIDLDLSLSYYLAKLEDKFYLHINFQDFYSIFLSYRDRISLISENYINELEFIFLIESVMSSRLKVSEIHNKNNLPKKLNEKKELRLKLKFNYLGVNLKNYFKILNDIDIVPIEFENFSSKDTSYLANLLTLFELNKLMFKLSEKKMYLGVCNTILKIIDVFNLSMNDFKNLSKIYKDIKFFIDNNVKKSKLTEDFFLNNMKNDHGLDKIFVYRFSSADIEFGKEIDYTTGNFLKDFINNFIKSETNLKEVYDNYRFND